MARNLKNIDSVLDYGGGNRMTGTMLRNLGWNGSYDVVDMSDDVDQNIKILMTLKL